MKLLGIEKPSKTVICGYAQEGDRYLSFSSTPNDVTIHSTFKVDDFPSYEHFAAVIGKWDPWVVFLKRPIKIKNLEFDHLMEKIKNLPFWGKERR